MYIHRGYLFSEFSSLQEKALLFIEKMRCHQHLHEFPFFKVDFTLFSHFLVQTTVFIQRAFFFVPWEQSHRG